MTDEGIVAKRQTRLHPWHTLRSPVRTINRKKGAGGRAFSLKITQNPLLFTNLLLPLSRLATHAFRTGYAFGVAGRNKGRRSP